MAVKLSKPTDTRQGYSVVLYGPPLTGKTSTLADCGFKVLLIDLDKNSTPLQDADNITVASIDNFEEYLEIKEAARAGKFPDGTPYDFELTVIDSMTSLENLIKTWVATKYAPNRKREIQTKFGCQADWQDLQDTEIAQVRDWQAFTKREKNPLNVMWVGHDMTLTNDMGMPSLSQIALQGKYASLRIMASVDAVFYMFKTTAGAIKKDAKDPNMIVRGIYTQQNGTIQAEARVTPTRRAEMKPFIFSPKWSDVLVQMGYKKISEK